MAAPPLKKTRGSAPPHSIMTMEVEKWLPNQVEQFSRVYRIDGYPWRLRLYGNLRSQERHLRLSLLCDKSTEAELWQCTANVYSSTVITHTFSSWDKNSHEKLLLGGLIRVGAKIAVRFSTTSAGDCWTLRPSLGVFAPRDGVLVIGKEKKKIQVNKESLAAQSPYFDRLFFGDFKEKNMREIKIHDVDYEEFLNVLRLTYEDVSLTDANVTGFMKLADKFQIKIVEDKVANYLLSSSSFSMCQKLLIAEEFNLNFVKKVLLSQKLSPSQLKEISESPEFDKLSGETAKLMFKEFCGRLGNDPHPLVFIDSDDS